MRRYTTRVSKVLEEGGSFLKQVNVSYGKSLDIIGVNTGLIQVHSVFESRKVPNLSTIKLTFRKNGLPGLVLDHDLKLI